MLEEGEANQVDDAAPGKVVLVALLVAGGEEAFAEFVETLSVALGAGHGIAVEFAFNEAVELPIHNQSARQGLVFVFSPFVDEVVAQFPDFEH